MEDGDFSTKIIFMYKEKNLLILLMIFYIVPILMFGDFTDLVRVSIFVLSIPFMYYRFTKNYKKEKVGEYINAAIVGCILGIMWMYPFSVHINKSIIRLTFTYANILGYWLGITGVIITSSIYRETKTHRLSKEFYEDPVKIIRDEKIKTILGGWWN